MTSSEGSRCAVRALERHDPMLGTAFPASRVLLVEQPGGWGIDGLLDSEFDTDVARRLVAVLSRRSTRVLAVRQPGRLERSGRARRWAFADCRRNSRAIVWGQFGVDAELLDVDFDALLRAELLREAEADFTGHELAPPEPLYLVCAHGRHDVCCAIEGRPVAAELARLRPGASWECSHLGGDRFAASILVLPLGVTYGRVPAGAAEDLAAATDRAEVLAPLLRGQVGLLPVVQAALASAHQQLQVMAVDDLRVLDVESVSVSGPAAEETAAVRLSTPRGVVRVPVAVRRGVTDRLTCRARQPSTPWVYLPGKVEIL